MLGIPLLNLKFLQIYRLVSPHFKNLRLQVFFFIVWYPVAATA
jgi:hypothetical protein